jgi:protein-S-isoprenylcysteine O-methyltransferase Ste14
MTITKALVGVIINLAIFGVLLFLPAGTLDWWRAWVFLLAIFILALWSTVSLFRANRELLEERFKPPIQPGQPLADKIIVMLVIVEFLGLIAFIPLDVFRFHLLPQPGPFVSSLGLGLFVAGWTIITLAMRENAFAAPVVRHQEERHQTVIDSGVYSVVRHPLYAGMIPLLVGMSFWLESYAAAILAGLVIVTLAVRILFEEQFLKRELAGYANYTERVRYRLIPYIW